MNKKSKQKLNIFRTINNIFNGIALKEMKQFILESETPTQRKIVMQMQLKEKLRGAFHTQNAMQNVISTFVGGWVGFQVWRF